MTGALGSSTESPVGEHGSESRLGRLFDQGTLQLLAGRDGSGALAARGGIEGMPAVAYAVDLARLGVVGCRHVVDAIDTAVRERVPLVGLWQDGETSRPEGVAALDGVGNIFAATVRASGRVPQISVVLGPAAGAYGVALTDIVIAGGPGPAAHVATEGDAAALARARELAVLLGRPGRLSPSDVTEDIDPGALPSGEMKPLVRAVLDGPGVELHAGWAPSIVTTLGRFGGRTVGVVANNGSLDPTAAGKAARFVRMCDALGVPLIVLVDVSAREWDARLVHAFAEAVVPRVTLVTRESGSAAYIAMNSKSLGATAVLAWPGAEIAATGREIGVVDDVIDPAETRRRIAAAIAAAPAARGAHGNIPL